MRRPKPTLRMAKRGVCSGLPSQDDTPSQSKVMGRIPRPDTWPKSWLTTTLLGAIQQTKVKYCKKVAKTSGIHWYTKVANDTMMKNLYREIFQPLVAAGSAGTCLCRECITVQVTRLAGHTIDAGQTRKRRAIPAIPKPMAWVEIMRRIWNPHLQKNSQYTDT